jgi:hypothetical protein
VRVRHDRRNRRRHCLRVKRAPEPNEEDPRLARSAIQCDVMRVAPTAPVVTHPPPQPQPAESMTLDECFKKCRELTSQTEAQCFDACRH